ncbi:MAG: 50S ribosomal protein L9 [Clostridiales bacterium]|jgi:large subunit ribosomal protein L9|nr:50S ribosomal protein L9 [Clostridiales bacterium]
MKVILLEDVKGTGKKGAVIEASEGHARNYLIPKKLAVEATPAHLNEIENKKKAALHKEMAELEAAQALAQKLSASKVRLEAKIGENGKLFGSITSKEIAAALSARTGLDIDKKKVLLDEPIKMIGEKQIEIKLHPQVTAKAVVEIVRREE